MGLAPTNAAGSEATFWLVLGVSPRGSRRGGCFAVIHYDRRKSPHGFIDSIPSSEPHKASKLPACEAPRNFRLPIAAEQKDSLFSFMVTPKFAAARRRLTHSQQGRIYFPDRTDRIPCTPELNSLFRDVGNSRERLLIRARSTTFVRSKPQNSRKFPVNSLLSGNLTPETGSRTATHTTIRSSTLRGLVGAPM